MVKGSGPAFSLEASGTLGDTLTFSRWKGRPYVRERVIPSNPRSGSQVGVRSMFAFLAQQWASLDSAEQATCSALAAQLVASNFNGFMSRDQKRWRNFLAPGKSDPVPETGTLATAGTETATAGVRQITVDFPIITDAGTNWGLMVFRALVTAFTPAFSNCIAVVEANAIGAVTFVDTPLAPDEYFYNGIYFTDDGLMGSAIGEVSATVT